MSSLAENVTIAVLTGQRPDLLHRTLWSLPERLRDECHLVVFHNSGDTKTGAIIDEFSDKYGLGLRYTCLDGLWPVGQATSMLFRLCKSERRSFVLHLQDDWECRVPSSFWLTTAMRILDDDPRVGQVRLRKITEKTRINRVGVDGGPVNWVGRDGFRVAPNAPFTLNPTLMRADDLPEQVESEVAQMGHFARGSHLVAQLVPGVFAHIGGKGRSLMRKAERDAIIRDNS